MATKFTDYIAAIDRKQPVYARLGIYKDTATNDLYVDERVPGAGIPVNVTFPATQAVTQSGTWNLVNISGTISLPTGAATETTLSALNSKTPALGAAAVAVSVPVTMATNQPAIPVLAGNSLVPVAFDNIAVNLAGATADVYTYKVAAATVATVTINYTDATKSVITTIVRS